MRVDWRGVGVGIALGLGHEPSTLHHSKHHYITKKLTAASDGLRHDVEALHGEAQSQIAQQIGEVQPDRQAPPVASGLLLLLLLLRRVRRGAVVVTLVVAGHEAGGRAVGHAAY